MQTFNYLIVIATANSKRYCYNYTLWESLITRQICNEYNYTWGYNRFTYTHTHIWHTQQMQHTRRTHTIWPYAHTEHILVWLAFNLLEDIDAAIDVIEGRWIHKHTINMFQIKFLYIKLVFWMSICVTKINAYLSIEFISIACNVLMPLYLKCRSAINLGLCNSLS